MPVLPCRHNLFSSYAALSQFLLRYQQNCQKNRPSIVSISLEIPQVDPLVVLQQIAQPHQISFYLENKGKSQAIAAIDAVAKLQVHGKNRFAQAQNFITSCLNNTINVGTVDDIGTHFFCSFGFYDQNTQAEYPFAAATVFLPRWQISRKRDRCVLVANLVLNTVNLATFFHDLSQIIRRINNLKYKFTQDATYNQTFTKNVTNINNFKNAIAACLDTIHSNYLSKIVLAQALDVKSAVPFNIYQSLANLRQIHPDCYTFCTTNGKGQNFIGASPERLISIQNHHLQTDALAGSAPRGKTAAEDTELANRLLISEKERHEHRVVIDFITQCLNQLNIEPHLQPSRLRRLANIQHLWTPIQAKVPEHVNPLEIVAKLHPTPAVAGVDRDIACAQIKQYETFERGLYAAPLGWVDYQGNSEFIVGIRSALIDSDRARLYAGAGIVAGSDPDKELAEIQLKLQALLKALV